MKNNNMSIVPVNLIPQALNVPFDNLISIFRTITGMEKICTDQNGIGLSAVQVGIPLKLFIVQRNNGYEYYLNCEYFGVGEKTKSIEGCLSLRDSNGELRRFEVERYSSVSIKGKQLKISDSSNLIIEDVDRTEKGLYAIVFQHEIDHFLGREKMIDMIGREIELI
jgi:peptide deformylase